ncbi:MAG: alpha-amylase family glycosyl hydrolase [Candidatus Omnitrophica bacterium]|nr:alpha-amylase family glycosyl hydrolase [Candidatus Omnitrophota bacterium]
MSRLKPIDKNPFLYQENAFFWLWRLEQRYRRTLSLGTIPEEAWDDLAASACGGMVWLMGIWQRSPAARRQALHSAALGQAMRQSVPDYTDKDVCGSPYAVYRYQPDARVGTGKELLQARQKLHNRGVRLILDFVPNHVAMDHPWIKKYPEYFISAPAERALSYPDLFFHGTASKRYFAHGKDPYFAPWQDTVQVDISHSQARCALQEQLLRMAKYCDGVRCDMAMLLISGIYRATWAAWLLENIRDVPEFWTETIAMVKRQFPKFIFIAEVYWDREAELQHMGFDYTYDKRLYDYLRDGRVQEIRKHLQTADAYLSRGVHFVENHDEPRAAAVWERKQSYAAATIALGGPGVRFIHSGQRDGNTVATPIQLCRPAVEPVHRPTQKFYGLLEVFLRSDACRMGIWSVPAVFDATDSASPRSNVLSGMWQADEQRSLWIVNYSSQPARAVIALPPADASATLPVLNLTDMLSKTVVNFNLRRYGGVSPQWVAAVRLDAWQVMLLKNY